MTIDQLRQFASDARELSATARSPQARKAYAAAAVFAQEQIEMLSREPEPFFKVYRGGEGPVCRFGQGDYRRDWP